MENEKAYVILKVRYVHKRIGTRKEVEQEKQRILKHEDMDSHEIFIDEIDYSKDYQLIKGITKHTQTKVATKLLSTGKYHELLKQKNQLIKDGEKESEIFIALNRNEVIQILHHQIKNKYQ